MNPSFIRAPHALDDRIDAIVELRRAHFSDDPERLPRFSGFSGPDGYTIVRALYYGGGNRSARRLGMLSGRDNHCDGYNIKWVEPVQRSMFFLNYSKEAES